MAIVIPLLEKLVLHQKDKKHYQPVSNLPYVRKLVENIAINRFSGHVEVNDLDEFLQSAYI